MGFIFQTSKLKYIVAFVSVGRSNSPWLSIVEIKITVKIYLILLLFSGSQAKIRLAGSF